MFIIIYTERILVLLSFLFSDWWARSYKFLVVNWDNTTLFAYYGNWKWAIKNGMYIFCARVLWLSQSLEIISKEYIFSDLLKQKALYCWMCGIGCIIKRRDIIISSLFIFYKNFEIKNYKC